MRLLISLITVGAAILAVPATAGATPAPDYGATVRCHFQVTARNNHQWTEAQLRRIAVTPPQIPAAASTQTVGWRFVVTRSMDKEIGPFRVIYRSPIQKGSATTTGDDGFTTMRADITLPGDPEGDRFVWYRVTLKMYWYNADGSVQNEVVYLMPDMHWIVNRHDFDTENYCPGLEQLQIDGG
jgi:hypothetical protein